MSRTYEFKIYTLNVQDIVKIFYYPCPPHTGKVYPQSTCRGRVEIGGVHLPLQLEPTPQLFT